MSNLTQKEKQCFIEVVNSHLDTFQSDLTGYNNAFGKVNANFKWAGKTRPIPMKLWAPAYGSHRAMLYNLKCQQLKDKGVLVSTADLDIHPVITKNSWITKNPSAAGKPLEQCAIIDVHLVIGFNPINKYLQDPTQKVTTHATICRTLQIEKSWPNSTSVISTNK